MTLDQVKSDLKEITVLLRETKGIRRGVAYHRSKQDYKESRTV